MEYAMPIYYIVEYPCEVRKELGDNAEKVILDAAAHRYGAGMSSDEGCSENRIPGILPKDRESFSEHCCKCPCNLVKRVTGRPSILGCTGIVSYPIAREFEEILVGTLVKMSEGGMRDGPVTAVDRLIDHIRVNRLSGERVARIRERGASFFEARDGPVPWAGYDERNVDSNQIMDAMFGEELSPEFGEEILLPFLDILREYFLEAMKEGDREVTGDTTLREILQYREAIGIAISGKCPVRSRM